MTEKLYDYYLIKIYRWNPEYFMLLPYLQTYIIGKLEYKLMVLDVLIKIKNEIDPSLTFRRSCREGICGSCAMNINGINTLACLLNLDDIVHSPINALQLADIPFIRIASPVVIYPLPHLAVIKDLVPDLTNFFNQYAKIRPWLHTAGYTKTAKREILQTKRNRELLNNLYECILCACCSASCPSYWWHEQKYLGPAILLQLYRWIIDSRDIMKVARLHLINNDALYKCHQILNCSIVCPKHLNPGLVLIKLRTRVDGVNTLKTKVDSLTIIKKLNDTKYN